VRYAYAITSALIVGGAAATLTLQQPVGAQVAQNAPGTVPSVGARPGAPFSFADLAAKLTPAVVNISTTQRIAVQSSNPFAGTPFDDFFRHFGAPDGGGGDDDDDNGGGAAPGKGGRPVTREATSLGSGFIISPDGYIVTNNHVISGGNPNASTPVESITVTLPDRTEYKARLVGRDTAADLAVLKIEARNLPFVQFGDSQHARVGDWVIAVGNPFGLGGSVTAGIISALHRNIGAGGAYDRYIQTDASINSGNSGGPMFDMQGNVIGINTAIYSPTGGNVGIGFAIPAEAAKPVVDVLMKGGTVKRGYLGIGIQPVTDDIATSLGLPKNHGEIVSRVEPGYGAARAGIQQGDVIVRVNNQDVTPDNTLSFIVSNLPVNSHVPIDLIRNGQHMSVNALIGQRPPEEQLAKELGQDDDQGATPGGSPNAGQQQARASLGLTLQPITPTIARQLGVTGAAHGLVVSSVDPSSDAAASGLQRGDIIVSINQQPVATTAAAAAIVAAAQKAGRPSVLLLVQRGNQPARFVGVKLNTGQ
jgi:serine protease Do